MDFSIRPFYPKDFLVVCRDISTCNTLVAGGRAMSNLFALSLWPWTRQVKATTILMPYLVPLTLTGVSANACTQHVVESLLLGLGIIIKVDDCTSRQDCMSVFWVWMRTDDPARIPSHRILVVEEPGRRAVRQEDGAETPSGSHWRSFRRLWQSPCGLVADHRRMRRRLRWRTRRTRTGRRIKGAIAAGRGRVARGSLTVEQQAVAVALRRCPLAPRKHIGRRFISSADASSCSSALDLILLSSLGLTDSLVCKYILRHNIG
ncbi:Wall-associated receptor kinase 5 [Hordeum vulgare]|nr:Wall-associated receptor kinase 5 [Hordeum vulgare]